MELEAFRPGFEMEYREQEKVEKGKSPSRMNSRSPYAMRFSHYAASMGCKV
jgi:hypothetical protein